MPLEGTALKGNKLDCFELKEILMFVTLKWSHCLPFCNALKWLTERIAGPFLCNTIRVFVCICLCRLPTLGSIWLNYGFSVSEYTLEI